MKTISLREDKEANSGVRVSDWLLGQQDLLKFAAVETTMLIKLMPSIAILHNPNAPGVLSLGVTEFVQTIDASFPVTKR